jgi:hypothetical protein
MEDWGFERFSAQDTRKVLSKYAHRDTLHDAFLGMTDLFRDPYDWVFAVRSLGFDGVLVDVDPARWSNRKHLVVWNPAAMYLQEV